MATKKNISALFDQAFTITDSDGNDWVMRPPNKQRGTEMAVLYAGIQNANRKGGACKSCGHIATEGLAPKTARAWESLQEREMEEVVLGKKMFDEMIEADLTASEMHWLALYTMWYWVLDPDTADTLADTYAQSIQKVNADGTEMDEETATAMDPKGPAPTTQPLLKNGPNME